MSMGWIAGGAALLGAGSSIYGANKSAKAMDRSTDATLAAKKETDRLNYARWLESQGIGADGRPVNIFLPRYASVRRPSASRAAAASSPGFRIMGAARPTMVVTTPASALPYTGGPLSRFGTTTTGGMPLME